MSRFSAECSVFQSAERRETDPRFSDLGGTFFDPLAISEDFVYNGKKFIKGDSAVDKEYTSKRKLVIFAAVLLAAVLYLEKLLGILSFLGGVVLPVVLGALTAFVLNIPMNGIEKRLKKLWSKSKLRNKDTVIRVVSVVLTIVVLLLFVVAIYVLVVPVVVSSVTSIYELVRTKWPEWAALLQEYNINTDQFSEWLPTGNVVDLVKQTLSNVGATLSSAFGAAGTVVSGISTALISLVIAVYILFSKETIAVWFDKLIKAYMNENVRNYLRRTGAMINETFSKFLSGQFVESCILGVMIFVSLGIFKIPHSGLIGFLTAITAFIPYVGAWISCGIGVILVLLTAPSKVITLLIVFMVVQFVENQFIYPNVVGSSVGLSPLWTMIALVLGGELFGLFGMIFFIPLMSVAVTLVGEQIDKRLEKNAECRIES